MIDALIFTLGLFAVVYLLTAPLRHRRNADRLKRKLVFIELVPKRMAHDLDKRGRRLYGDTYTARLEVYYNLSDKIT